MEANYRLPAEVHDNRMCTRTWPKVGRVLTHLLTTPPHPPPPQELIRICSPGTYFIYLSTAFSAICNAPRDNLSATMPALNYTSPGWYRDTVLVLPIKCRQRSLRREQARPKRERVGSHFAAPVINPCTFCGRRQVSFLHHTCSTVQYSTLISEAVVVGLKLDWCRERNFPIGTVLSAFHFRLTGRS